MYKGHKLYKGDKGTSFLVDGKIPFRICDKGNKIKNNPNIVYAMHHIEVGHDNQIPLWLFGFVY